MGCDPTENRTTIATFSFPYPATPEQRDAFQNRAGIIPLPKLFYELSPDGWSSRTLGPRPVSIWVLGPQTLADGREVENALLIQKWQRPEVEDAAAGAERERRERWMSARVRQLGLATISAERYTIYRL
jgi:hypothetical protein